MSGLVDSVSLYSGLGGFPVEDLPRSVSLFFSLELKDFPISCQEGKSLAPPVLGTRWETVTDKGGVGSGAGAHSASGMHQTMIT